MSKNGLLLVSLVAAIPGALLVYLMVMSFINYAAGPSMWPKALAGMALLVGLLLAVMPAGIFVYGGPKAEKAPEKKADDEAAVESESGYAETIIAAPHEDAESSELESSTDVTDENLEVVEAESEEFGSEEFGAGDDDTGSQEFDVGSDFEIGADEAEVVEADDDFEEDSPKKKKK